MSAILAIAALAGACSTEESPVRPGKGKPTPDMMNPDDDNGEEVPPVAVADGDGDGVPDTTDAFPYDDNRFDGDLDEIPDGADKCRHKPVAESQHQHNDADDDGVGDDCDNLPTIYNPGQEDTDNDGIGDKGDNSALPNPGQEDADGDGDGDVSDCSIHDASIHHRRADEDLIDPNCDEVDWDCEPGDEGEPLCNCVIGTQRDIGTDLGICTKGLEECQYTFEGGSTWVTIRFGQGQGIEICNGEDDDCDGLIDNGFASNGLPCACTPGEERLCGPNSNDGICRTGLQACEGGVWGLCYGAVMPLGQEACNGQDDDCDGNTDEDFDVGERCSGIGACGVGVFECATLNSKRCSTDPDGSHPGSSAEVCDERDNDCDGDIDEGLGDQVGYSVIGAAEGVRKRFGEACNGVGRCSTGGIYICAGAYALECLTENAPIGNPADIETGNLCNGLDDDCDGNVDDGCSCVNGATQNCGIDTGECNHGVQTCGLGRYSTECGGTGFVGPRGEVANGKDDDCDGNTDDLIEGTLGQPCTGIGRCGAGVWEASAVAGHAVCSSMPDGSRNQNVTETCNGADDDCDGDTDEEKFEIIDPQFSGYLEGTFRNPTKAYLNNRCVMTGVCAGPARLICDPNGSGLLICNTSAALRTPPIRVSGVEEATQGLCNGLDDDCDGDTDELCACTGGVQRACGIAVLPCTQGVQTCSARGEWGNCVGGITPVAETCNDRDDNCDGDTDEGYGKGIECDGRGLCGIGVKECAAAGSANSTRCSTDNGGSNPQAQNERCNEVDDDCDGDIDDLFNGDGTAKPRPGMTCTMLGICGTGKYECSGTFEVACDARTRAKLETCNGADDDCDGDTDEGFNVGQSCTGTGYCAIFTGVWRCNATGVAECSANDEGKGKPEVLSDGVDDDCDGFQDR
ncbi:MAG: MopE-related protein [Patescibacteria group bacterium]